MVAVNRVHMRRRWALYLTLVTLRFFGAIHTLPGYIHPDEFFQGGQELFFGQRYIPSLAGLSQDYELRTVPWEFEPNNAVRSIVPPKFMVLFPLRVYVSIKRLFMSNEQYTISDPSTYHSISWTESMNQLSGKDILIIPRIFMTLLSLFFLDGSLWILLLFKQREKFSGIKSQRGLLRDLLLCVYQQGPPIGVIILASSWPCLVFGIRPFTNTLEAMCLSFLLVVVNLDLDSSKEVNQPSLLSAVWIGMTCSIGIFVRFTFAFFAFPVVLIWFWHTLVARLRSTFYVVTLLTSSFLATSILFIMVDSEYYSSQVVDRQTDESSVRDMLSNITPLNALLYNSQTTNLAEHGLHPRITHAFVNMPMLYGPLVLLWYGSVVQSIFKRSTSKIRVKNDSIVITTCQWTILSGLIVLSCAPHQEPRFLLPCMVPLVLISGFDTTGDCSRISKGSEAKQLKSIKFMTVWVLFNVILYVFFGWLHQGGLIDSILNTSNISNRSGLMHLYYKTYMPPSFLTRKDSYLVATESTKKNQSDDKFVSYTCSNNELRANQKECKILPFNENNAILDLKGNEPNILVEVLQSILSCSDKNRRHSVYVTTPLSVANSLLNGIPAQNNLESFEWQGFIFRKEYISRYSHVSTEDMPIWDGSIMKFLSQLQLIVYVVVCGEHVLV